MEISYSEHITIFDKLSTKEKVIKLIEKCDKSLYSLEYIFYDLHMRYWKLNINFYNSENSLESLAYISITHDLKETLEVYKKIIHEELNDKSIITIGSKFSYIEPKILLNKKTSIEFITNLEDMLFNVTPKPKSARSN